MGAICGHSMQKASIGHANDPDDACFSVATGQFRRVRAFLRSGLSRKSFNGGRGAFLWPTKAKRIEMRVKITEDLGHWRVGAVASVPF